MQKINIKQFNKYKKIFGIQKIQALWEDFVNQAEDAWQKMDILEMEACRYIFHNWRSSGKIFGLDDFSQLCQQIEENILSHRFAKAKKQIQAAKLLYQECLSSVSAMFSQKENDNEK